MTKDTTPWPKVPWEALQTLVVDHGDQFRWSISQASRNWVSLTHWGADRYNTAIELPIPTTPDDFWNAVAVLCTIHAHKCFRGAHHTDTWRALDKVTELVAPSLDWLGAHPTFAIATSDDGVVLENDDIEF